MRDKIKEDEARNTRLAMRVRDYWKRKGRDIQLQIVRERDPTSEDRTLICIRSASVNGFPAKSGRAAA